MRFPGFIGASYQNPSVNVDCQRTVNLYPEINESGSSKEKEVISLRGTPGFSLLVDLGSGPWRGAWRSSNGRCFIVSYNKLYELDSEFVAAERGTLNSNSGPVSISDNGIALVMVDGADGYGLVFATDVFAEITDPDFPGADTVVFVDGYFIFNKPDSGQFFISDLNSLNFDALDIATSEGNPDDVVAVMADHRDVWVFNEDTTEVFYNSGNADFPFERIQGAFIEHGLVAAFSVQKMNNTVFWVGRDDKGAGTVYMAKGYQPQRISTHAIEAAIATYGDLSTTTSYSYQDSGHFFYCLNFPNADRTWVYDSSTGMWHERTYMNNGQQERHRVEGRCFAFATQIAGDYENGNIYSLSSAVFTDNGDEIARIRVTPHVSSGGKKITHDQLQVDIESGVGLDGVGQGTDPKAMLDWSDDGGHTWSNEKWVSIGKIGQTKMRALWRRLGMSRDRVYRFKITDPVKVALIGADIEVTVGAS